MAHDIAGLRRTDDVLSADNVDFVSLMLSSNVLDGLERHRFKKPSPVQLKAIPLGKCGLGIESIKNISRPI